MRLPRLLLVLVASFAIAAPVSAAPVSTTPEQPWSNLPPITPAPAGNEVGAAAFVPPATISGVVSAKVPRVSGQNGAAYCDSTDCRSFGTDGRLHIVTASGVMSSLLPTGTVPSNIETRVGATMMYGGSIETDDGDRAGVYRSTNQGLTWSFTSFGTIVSYISNVRCLTASVCVATAERYDAATEQYALTAYRTTDKGVTWTATPAPAAMASLSIDSLSCVVGTGCLVTATNGDDEQLAFVSSPAASSWTQLATLPAAIDFSMDREIRVMCESGACVAVHAVMADSGAEMGHYEIYVATTSFSTWSKRPNIAATEWRPSIDDSFCSPLLCAFTTGETAVRAAGAAGTWTRDTSFYGVLAKANDLTALGCASTFCLAEDSNGRLERVTTPRTASVRAIVGYSGSLNTWICADAPAATPLCMLELSSDDPLLFARSTDGFATVELVTFPNSVTTKYRQAMLGDCPNTGCLLTFSTIAWGGRTAIYRTTNGSTFTRVSGTKAIAGLGRSILCSAGVCAMAHSSSKILRSTDAGLTWKMSATGPDDGLSTAAACGGTTCLSLGWEEYELYRSADAGTTWAEIDLAAYGPAGTVVDTLSMVGCSTGNKSCFVRVGYVDGEYTETKKLLRFGATGVGVALTPPTDPFWIVGGAGTVLLYSDEFRLYRSTNNGTSWTNVSSGLSGKFNLVDNAWSVSWSGAKATISGIDNATGNAKVFRSTDGLTWTKGAGSASR
jgi:hypothetical protein